MIITAELSPGRFATVDLVQWTPTGMVQVRHCRVIAEHAIYGVYQSVPAMKLIHSEGRSALARALADLPTAHQMAQP